MTMRFVTFTKVDWNQLRIKLNQSFEFANVTLSKKDDKIKQNKILILFL